ncbi:MAG: hypothetical protein EBS18_02500 [Actinobacteria bacterium]|nr:hypothetical protein [Actinomycetota bacterium]
MWNIDVSQIIYNYGFVGGGAALVLWGIFQLGVHKSIEKHMEEITDQIRPISECLNELSRRLDRIEYALYNDGQTGLINKVDHLVENQQIIKTEIEIIKVRAEA